jgi:hypothetical protein
MAKSGAMIRGALSDPLLIGKKKTSDEKEAPLKRKGLRKKDLQ